MVRCGVESHVGQAEIHDNYPSRGPLPLILAVVIHDGEDIDHRLDEIQRFALQKYSNPWIAEGSPVAEEHCQ